MFKRSSQKCRDKVEVFKGWVAEVTQHYDPSHAVQHFERVEKLALELAATEPRYNASEATILRMAAWAHDVCDHKLCPAKEAPSREAAMRKTLLYDCELSHVDTVRVLLIADNISLSKEKAGKLNRAILQGSNCELLRDLVSDADKLDALGRQGLIRIVEHHAAQFSLLNELGSTGKLLSDVRYLATEHLLPRQKYLCTAAAIEKSVALVFEMQMILQDDVELERLCEQALPRHLSSSMRQSQGAM